jgi:hypothetical protein
MSVRGIPVQDLVENQDPDVLYFLDEVTGVKTPIVAPVAEPEEKPRRRKPKAEEVANDGDAEGVGE